MESLEIEQTEGGVWAAVHNDSRVYIADLATVVKWIQDHPKFGKWHSVDLVLTPRHR